MILVCMLNTDEEALVCDFAETYRIYNYKEIPCKMAAIYAKGLKENARIKMKLAGVKVTLEDMLLEETDPKRYYRDYLAKKNEKSYRLKLGKSLRKNGNG